MSLALPLPLPERIYRWRDSLLASARFQNWAAKFPLTRPKARREAKALFDLCAGFVYAQTLCACVELDLFNILAGGPLEPEILARRSNVPLPNIVMLLKAAVSLRLLALSGKSYRLGPLGAALRGNPGIAAMVKHHRLFYADLADPVALLRGTADTQLSRFWPYRGQAGASSDYSALMSATQPMIAAGICAAYDFTRHKCLLDIGGGDGSFLRYLAPRAPHLRLCLFDLPAVAESARARLPFAEVFSGDFKKDNLPAGADIVTLIRVLHDHDDDAALAVLQAARTALPPGGMILLAEPMAGTKGAEPVGDAYFGFYLLAMGSGRARRPAEIEALLRKAGFGQIRHIPTPQPMLTSVMTATVSFS